MTQTSDTFVRAAFQARISDPSFLPPATPVVVMLSGGGDSIALATLLITWRDACQAGTATLNDGSPAPSFELTALHINHGLREAALDDESFVRTFCEAHHLPLEVRTVDVAAYAKNHHLNEEDAGREIRYGAAREIIAAKSGDENAAAMHRPSLGVRIDARDNPFAPAPLGYIATGHSLDDRVETFFARALYGSGTGALGSIRAQRDDVIRPLIDCSRADIRAFLRSEGIGWREDESNGDTSRTRANIRHTLVPACETINPAFRDALARTMDLVAEDDALLSSMAHQFARDFTDDRVDGEHIIFNLNFMRTLEPTMFKRVVRDGILSTFPDASRMEARHFEALAQNADCEGYVQDLPCSLRAESKCDTLKITRKRAQTGEGGDGRLQNAWATTVLTVDGKTDLGPAGALYMEEVDPTQVLDDPYIANVDGDVFLGALSAGPAREGERIRPLGLDGSQLLSDVFIDAKVAREERPLVPVVRDGSTVVWVAGQKLADRYRITPETTRAYQIEWVRKEEER